MKNSDLKRQLEHRTSELQSQLNLLKQEIVEIDNIEEKTSSTNVEDIKLKDLASIVIHCWNTDEHFQVPLKVFTKAQQNQTVSTFYSKQALSKYFLQWLNDNWDEFAYIYENELRLYMYFSLNKYSCYNDDGEAFAIPLAINVGVKFKEYSFS